MRWSSIQGDEETNDQTMVTLYKVYCVVLAMLEYAVPLFIISMAYFRMGLKLWVAETPGHADMARDDMILKNKKKVLQMMLVVVGVFSVCWLPWQGYFVASVVTPEVNQWKYINIMFFIFHWLAMSNSCYNPFIYGIFSVSYNIRMSKATFSITSIF